MEQVNAGHTRRHRLDICHKHHKQRLCKINSTLGKISPGEEMSCVITRIFSNLFDTVDMV